MTEPAGEPSEIAVVTVADLSSCGIEDERRAVIRDRAAWQALWAEIHAPHSERPPLPEVDFAREMVLVVACGMRRSGGYDVVIERAVRDGDRLRVTVRETCPPPDAMTSSALTQPLQVVRVPAAPKVEWSETRDPSCR